MWYPRSKCYANSKKPQRNLKILMCLYFPKILMNLWTQMNLRYQLSLKIQSIQKIRLNLMLQNFQKIHLLQMYLMIH